MEEEVRKFVNESNQERIEKLVSKLELEEDRELEEIIIKMSSLVV